MAFNHYAKLARIITSQPQGWYIRRIDEPTSTKNFKGETVDYQYYYRLYSADDLAIPYGKFQQIERLARALKLDVGQLPIVD